MRILVCFLAVALLGCGGSEDFIDGPPDAALVGTWNLTSVNGVAVPVTVVTAGGATEVDSGRLVLVDHSSGSLYFSNARDTATNGEQFNETGDVSYSRNGTSVALTFVVGNSVITQGGTLSGDTLTMSYSTLPFLPAGAYVYVRP
jgi:hypothetical protein